MYIKIVFVSLLFVFIQHTARIIYFLGYHVTVYNHKPGPCKLVPEVEYGSEDMETLPNGLTFITSGFIWSVASKKFKKYYYDKKIQGSVLLYDFNKPDNGVRELDFSEGFDRNIFCPHGISVIQNEDTGTITVFVVNHFPGMDRIEKFEFVPEEMMLQHIQSYSDDLITLANDVAATSENSFYLTNYAHYRDHLSITLEVMMFFPWGSVLYYDGENFEVVVDSLIIPNGIHLSQDQKEVYVANGLFESISMFHREENDTLTLDQEFMLYSSPDNILVDPKTGNLLVATHPVSYMTAEYLENPANLSPCKVLMVNMKNTRQADGITELFSDDGTSLSGCSVASLFNNRMLIGTIHSSLMSCETRTIS